MGVTLTKALQWSRPDRSGVSKLEDTQLNEDLLKNIASFVEQFSIKHPHDAAMPFAEALQWRSALQPSDFRSDYNVSDSLVESHETDSKGCPLLHMDPPELSISSFKHLSKFLQIAQDRKLKEVQACLEANGDAVEKILGTEEDDESSEHRNRLQLILKQLDMQLLDSSIQYFSQDVLLSPDAVKRDVELLQGLCGEEGLLKSVQYTADYEFTNGCRSPPWRQEDHGEIAYLIIETCDAGTLFITCSTDGVFLNAGVGFDEGEDSYRRKSRAYTDLLTLLKNMSPHFAENFRNQDFQGEPQTTRKIPHVEAVDVKDASQTPGSYERWGKNVHQKPGQQLTPNKNLEPSLMWKNLGMMPSQESGTAAFSGYTSSAGSQPATEPALKSAVVSESHVIKELQMLFWFKKNVHSSLRPKQAKPKADDLSLFSLFSRSRRMGCKPSAVFTSLRRKPAERFDDRKNDMKDSLLLLLHIYTSSREACQLAIRDVGGLEILINLLDTDELKCKIGSLKILKEISRNPQIRRSIADLGGLQTMVSILDSPEKQLKCLAAETIANVAKFRQARRTVRHHGGIQRLSDARCDYELMTCTDLYIYTGPDSDVPTRSEGSDHRRGAHVKLLDCVPPNSTSLSAEQDKEVEVARCGALALWSCSKSTRNKEAIRKAGGIPLLARLLKSTQKNMLIPVVGTLQECASERSYRTAIQSEGMIEDLVKNLSCDNQELQMHCASAIFKVDRLHSFRESELDTEGVQSYMSMSFLVISFVLIAHSFYGWLLLCLASSQLSIEDIRNMKRSSKRQHERQRNSTAEAGHRVLSGTGQRQLYLMTQSSVSTARQK
ncbi:Armadillo repeat-containing protein 4 [Bagarius yarrelli]|uniref:Armadillo repeat-containing protein 4 n=1 Tax=Bagarius yarrelli TaxID=175774 RepID=A0A556V8L1_BAGYA|nr:Armadillo repeat-containing protein 4 [Bagarius yarrelli]